MAVETLVTSATSTGNGVTTVFPLPFVFLDNTHIQVSLDGVLQNSGYTVSGANNPAGGSVTFTAAPANGVVVYRQRVVPLTQDVDTVNNETILQDVLDRSLDKLTMIAQETREKTDRAFIVPVGEAGGPIPAIGNRRGRLAVFADTDEALLTVSAVTEIDILAAGAAASTVTNLAVQVEADAAQAAADALRAEDAADGTAGVIYGYGIPTDNRGGEGQSYIDQATGLLYGPKKDGTWAGTGTYTFAAHTAPTVPFPLGAAGLWFMKDRVTNQPVPQIPNRVTAEPPITTFNVAPRRQFANTNLYTATADAIVDANAAFLDGTNDASSVTFAGGALKYVRGGAGNSTTAGTYSVFVTLRKTGGAGALRIGDFTAGLTAITPTGTWGRYAASFTMGAAAAFFAGIFSDAANNGITFEAIDLDIVKGNVDPRPLWQNNTTSTAITLGVGGALLPTLNAASIGFNAAATGIMQWPTLRTPTAVTVAVLARKTGAQPPTKFASFLSKIGAQNDFSILMGDNGSGPNLNAGLLWNGSNQLDPQRGDTKLLDTLDGGWRIFTFRHSPTLSGISLNDVSKTNASGNGAAASFKDLYVGSIAAPSFFAGYEIGAIGYYERSLSQAEVTQLQMAMYSEVTAAITRAPQKLVFIIGDSIAASSSGINWPYQKNVVGTATPVYQGFNLAVAGATISSCASVQVPALLALLASFDYNGRVPDVILHVGVNSIYPTGGEYVGNAAGALNAIRDTIVAPLKAVGCKVIVEQMYDSNFAALPQSASWPADKIAFNAGCLSREGVDWDRTINFDLDTRLSTPSGVTAANNAANFPDKLHPSDQGYSYAGTLGIPVLNSLGTAG